MINKVKIFNQNHLAPLDANIRIHDIVSEVGELAKEVIKAQDYGQKTFAVTKDLFLEYGDVLYSLLSFGIENNIDIEDSLEQVINKYKARFANKKHIGSNE